MEVEEVDEHQRKYREIREFLHKYHITKRESEIFLMIAIYGCSDYEIAEHCRISEKTVKKHLSNIMNKAGMKSIRQLLSLLFNHVLMYREHYRN
ncbi:Spore germination protein GerE [compost metagenome]